MPIKLISSGGGSIILDAPSTGSNFTLTVPAETGNVITTAASTGINASAISTGTISSGRLPSSGVSAASLTTGTIPKARMYGGAVLQVVTAIKTDQYYSTGGGWEDITGLAANITPLAATSKILVTVHVNFSKTGNGGDSFVRLLRDGNLIGNGNDGYFGQSAGQDYFAVDCRSVVFLDSPNTTSSVNYKVQLAPGGGCYVNSRGLDGSFDVSSTISLLEIAQ